MINDEIPNDVRNLIIPMFEYDPTDIESIGNAVDWSGENEAVIGVDSYTIYFNWTLAYPETYFIGIIFDDFNPPTNLIICDISFT